MELPIPSAHPSPPGALPRAVLGLGALFLPNKASHIFHISVFFFGKEPPFGGAFLPVPLLEGKAHTNLDGE